jgi:hypothetical protein
LGKENIDGKIVLTTKLKEMRCDEADWIQMA